MVFNRSFAVLGGLTFGVLASLGANAKAQYRPQTPPTQSQPREQTVATVQANRPPTGYVPPQAPPAYGYGPVQYNGPWGGALTGASDVINAQGNFMIQNQQAVLMQQEVKQAKVDTNRKTFDNWMYERDMTPTLEDNRERAQMEQYRRSRNDPPLNEIWSGKALNDLLQSVQKSPSPGPMIPIDPGMLAHINVTSGMGHSGMGLLKSPALQWPVTLQGDPYAAECKRIEQLLPQAMKQAQQGPPPAATINALTGSIDKLFALLKQNIADIDANDYMRSKRYLNELRESCKVLQQPNAAKYVTGQFSAQGNSVGELVSNMTRSGLLFGPATAGDQEAYTALYRSMVYYDSGVSQYATR